MTDTLAPLRRQWQQLQDLHANGTLDDAAHAAAVARTERAIVDAVVRGAAPASAPAPARAPRRLLLAALGAVGVLGFVGYRWAVSPTAEGAMPAGFAAAAPEAGASAPHAPHALGREPLEAMVGRLGARLQAQPGDAEGWAMLGRSQSALGQHGDAVASLRRALALRADDAAAMADLADALAVLDRRSLAGEAGRWLAQALKLEPDNLKALALAGTAAYDRGDDTTALRHWDHAVRVGPAESPLVAIARNGAADARARSGAAPAAAAATAPASISGTVTLSAALRAQVSPEDTLFVFARPAEGSRMPLAILRKRVKDLPLRYTLDDSMAMSPDARLSTATAVVVGARVSRSGQATPQPGDLEGLSGTVKPGARDVAVEIAAAARISKL